MPSGFNIKDSAKRRLWGAMLSLRELYPSTEKWNNEFLPAIEALFEKYTEDINLYHLAFPKDWAVQLVK